MFIRSFFLIVLWVTSIAVWFGSFWSIPTVHLPILITLLVAMIATLLRRTKLWVPACSLGYIMLAVSIGVMMTSLATGYVGTVTTDTGPVAAKENYFATKVGTVYEENHPIVKMVDPRYTNDTTEQVDMYTITLYGHFRRGTLQAVALRYNISADGARIWDIEGFSSTGSGDNPVWQDDNLP